MKSNFDFIRPHWPLLYEYGFFSEKYLFEDPDSSLLQLRKFSEICVREIYNQNDVKIETQTFYQIATNPQFYDMVPENIYRSLNFLRIEGNKGAHPKKFEKDQIISTEHALHALKEAYSVACWLFQTFISSKLPLPTFKISRLNNPDEMKWKAQQGDPYAQYSTALKYYYGRDVNQNFQTAAYWFREAAAQGHARAQAYIGAMLLFGKTLKKERDQAVLWIKKSAKNSEPIGMTLLGQMYLEGDGVEKAPEKAVYWLKMAAENEDPVAQICLGQMYLYGNGVQKNLEMAFEWTLRASQYDDPVAYCNLGLFYEEGLWVKQDFEQAYEWYKKAAEKGLPDAQAAVGMYCLKGVGCQQNQKLGLQLLKEAANKGSLISYLNIGLYYKQEREYATTIDWLLKAAEKGSAEAQYELADTILMANEDQIPVGLTVNDARRWMKKAEIKGHPQAQKVMAELRKNEMETHRQLAVALNAFRKNVQTFFKNTQLNDIGRNDPCPCGSGKKYKKCCLKND
ncbi:cobalamin biosynthesis protein CobT [Candidatus Magnetomorum sp. HK-1]|nr:cobalamin biosynthesis protein CobT [Candidatus Magnetomorum sp. HK-1]